MLATEATALKTKIAALEKELESAKKSSPKLPSKLKLEITHIDSIC